MGVPSLRIYEDIICHHYYNEIEGEGHIGLDEGIEEKKCKGEEVQNRLNVLIAGVQFLGAIPGMFMRLKGWEMHANGGGYLALVTTVPYGLLADR